MKKKLLFFIFMPLILIIFNCTVNDKTGLIQIKNSTYEYLTNVKIGQTLLAAYVSPGSYIDYWYYNTITGKLTADGIQIDNSIASTTYQLKTGYWFTITAEITNDGYERVDNFSAFKQGDSSISSSDWQED